MRRMGPIPTQEYDAIIKGRPDTLDAKPISTVIGVFANQPEGFYLMSNLRDGIRLEIERGNIAEPFTADDLRQLLNLRGDIGGQPYDAAHVGTILANHSTGPGNRVGESVKRGGERLFIKHAKRGTYSIDYKDYEIELDDFESGDEGEGSSRPIAPKPTTRSNSLSGTTASPHDPRDDIARRFVDYVRNKPFRIARNASGGLSWYPAAGSVTGWLPRLSAYDWGGANWPTTELTINTFVTDLHSLEHSTASTSSKQTEALRIYTAIRKWGNPKGKKYTGAELLAFLNSLWLTGKISAVDSTLTKLYAFARPHHFVIYDSRVAAAILTIAEDIYRKMAVGVDKVDDVFRKHYSHLGQYNGMGGTRQRGYRSKTWPGAYGVVAAQMEANHLCERIVERLNKINEDNRGWKMREVEAVLFMEGY